MYGKELQMKIDAMELLEKIGEKYHSRKTVDIAGFSIVLRTLTAEEETRIYHLLDGLKGIDFLHKHKVASLARSIVCIDGQDFDDLSDSQVEMKMDVIRKWPTNIIDELYSVYSGIMKGTEQESTKSEIKEQDA
jgi:hypothetical protein